jgi:hypothetical protein
VNLGVRTCLGGVEVDLCVPLDGAPDDSVCDGVDGDCDGEVDEDFLPIANSCGLGECATLGTIECIGGEETDTCTPTEPPSPVDDNCNFNDENCNGQLNEDYVPIAIECGFGVCVSTGQLNCEGGIEVPSCTPGEPLSDVDTVCDGIDEDCDEFVDEDFAGESTTCGEGACGAGGAFECLGGEPIDSCSPGEPLPEICNEVDDDCDGSIDDGACGECVPSTEICDGLDNDCDEVIDNLPPGNCETPLPGICTVGHFACVNERAECVPNNGPFPENQTAGESCFNGVDDDCDGVSDEGDSGCNCEPLPEICNGRDDNCDEVIDEGCGEPPPGETCDTAMPIDPGSFEFTLDGFKDDGGSSCMPPDSVDRWFLVTVPEGPQRRLEVTFNGEVVPDGYAVLGGPCTGANELFCGVEGGPVLLPGTYRIIIEGRPDGGFFGMNVDVFAP